MTSQAEVTQRSEAVQPLTTQLGAFVAGLRHGHIPEPARVSVRAAFADTVGVLIAGAAEPCTALLARTLVADGAESTLLFGPRRASSHDATWVNATAAHALDYDDAALRGHPSAVLVPTILAEAQVLGSTGEQMLAAYVAGFETWGELVHREADAHHRKGWHPTGLFGTLASAAASASLRGLDAPRAAHALALAASQSAGLMSNFGSMTKPFHAGRSAHAGVAAARLAEAGFTASLDAIEHPQGFLTAVSLAGRVDRTSELRAGRDWHLLRNGPSVKKYPMCYCTHRPIDAMIALRAAHRLRAGDVRSIAVTISGRNATVLRNHDPRTGLAAKFSIEFAMAAALVEGRVTLGEVTDETVRRTDIRAVFEKVRIVLSAEEDPESGYAPFDEVAVELADGQVLRSEPIRFARGAHEEPLSADELREKFDACLAAAGSALDARRLFDTLMELDRAASAAVIPGLG
jgi:2-methylcitrate dehydratase PrpD